MNTTTNKLISIKSMLSLVIITAVISILSACATPENFKKVINSWDGKSAQQLVDQFGFPNDIITAPDGHKVYQYSHIDVGYFHQAGCNNGTCLPLLYVKDCTAWFKLSSANIITEIKYKGTGCVYGSSHDDFGK